MPAPRALLASLGASTCLVLAGTLGLAGVSTLVAFQGWPGVQVPTFGADQALLSAPGAVARRDSRAVVTPAARPRRAQARPVAQRPAVRPARRVTASVVAPTAPPRTPARHPHALQGAAPAADPAPKLKVDAATPVQQVGAAVGAGVAASTSQLGDVVRPVSPGLGQVLVDTGRVGGGAVAGITDVVAALLAGLQHTAG